MNDRLKPHAGTGWFELAEHGLPLRSIMQAVKTTSLSLFQRKQAASGRGR